VVTCNCLVR
jgi:hypothetical protein